MRSGDPCTSCDTGVMLTYHSRRTSDDTQAVKYLKCRDCGATGKDLRRVRPRMPVPASGTEAHSAR